MVQKIQKRASTMKSLIAVLALALFSTSSFAGIGSSLMQTAPVKKPGEFEAKAQGDIIFNHGGGFNVSPHFGFGILEHYFDGEIYLGTGTTNFFFGGMTKLNLLPDVEGQVGLSLNLGIAYLRDKPEGADSSFNSTLLTFGILVSKELNSPYGKISPYGTFQFEGLINSNNNTVPLTLIAGAKFHPDAANGWNFYSELSINIHQSFWGLALGAGYPFQ